MTIFEAFILGLIQGLTEFLPISSSGHLEIGKALLNTKSPDHLLFTIVVHGATVLSTIAVFRKEILSLINGLLKFEWNFSTQYIFKLAVSAIPILIIGLLFYENIETMFFGNTVLVGFMLFVTGLLLVFAHYVKITGSEVGFIQSLIIGTTQVLAILPGISRSGATIAAALLTGVKKEQATRFSFLMVLAPIIGANILAIGRSEVSDLQLEILPLMTGFVVAFISGFLACKWMITLVNKRKLIFFAYYCFVVGTLVLIFSF